MLVIPIALFLDGTAIEIGIPLDSNTLISSGMLVGRTLLLELESTDTFTALISGIGCTESISTMRYKELMPFILDCIWRSIRTNISEIDCESSLESVNARN